MRKLAKAVSPAFVAAALTLAGCGGGGGVAGLGPIPDGHGRLTIKVKWPAADSSSRLIMTATQSIKILVSGPGIPTPITRVINAPQTTATLTVPVGSDRLVDAQGFDAPDAGGTQIQKAYQAAPVPEVADGQTYNVSLYLTDLWDPADDTYTGATTIATDGTPSGLHVIDEVATDWYDYFKFTAVAGEGYTFATQNLVGTGVGRYTLMVFDTDGSTVLASNTFDAMQPGAVVWSAPSDGDYFVSLWVLYDIRMEYRLAVAAGGTGDIGVIVD